MLTVVTVQLLATESICRSPVTLDQCCKVHGKLLAAVKRHGKSPDFKAHSSGRFDASGVSDITRGGPFEKYVFLVKTYFKKDFPAGFDFSESQIRLKFLAIIKGFGAGDDAGPKKSEDLRKMCAVLECLLPLSFGCIRLWL